MSLKLGSADVPRLISPSLGMLVGWEIGAGSSPGQLVWSSWCDLRSWHGLGSWGVSRLHFQGGGSELMGEVLQAGEGFSQGRGVTGQGFNLEERRLRWDARKEFLP